MSRLLSLTISSVLVSSLGCRQSHPIFPVNFKASTVTGIIKEVSQQSESSDVSEAIALIQNYYNAINRHHYRQAYNYWENNGLASGQSFAVFKQGFAKTSSVRVDIGKPISIEGAAGSRYLTIPVTIKAIATNGQIQQFKGNYTLRRTLVEGSTEQQRRWHFYSADIKIK